MKGDFCNCANEEDYNTKKKLFTLYTGQHMTTINKN